MNLLSIPLLSVDGGNETIERAKCMEYSHTTTAKEYKQNWASKQQGV
jgi:hypothetical protein